MQPPTALGRILYRGILPPAPIGRFLVVSRQSSHFGPIELEICTCILSDVQKTISPKNWRIAILGVTALLNEAIERL